jgi:hypothetical protein
LQGLFYQLENGLDYMGRLSLCKNVFGEECFRNLGFGEIQLRLKMRAKS